MTKALRKNTRRSISGSLGRYIAILLIIMLGVAFLTGLRDTRPIMSATETAYVKNTKLYDLRLISTIGFDADDVAAVHVTNIGHKQIKERVNYMLELVHLEDKAKVYPDLLSGGEQQRVAVARALAHAPKLVIADEPTGNIDPELSLEMMELLERVSEMGITVLVVTHEHELVRHFDRRVVTLSGGHIISDVPTGSMIPHPPVDPKELEMEVSLV